MEQQNKEAVITEAIRNPLAVSRELNNRSLYHFIQYFWKVYTPREFTPNWHIELFCKELETLAYSVSLNQPKPYDLVINVSPGSTKTACVSIFFPIWCWTKWYWMRFITASYAADLSLESAEYCRDIIKSPEFQAMYPELGVKEDKDKKSNYKITKKVQVTNKISKTLNGGGRYSTSVGGTLTGFHGDIIIIDDPLNPKQAASDIELGIANRWIEQTVPTRKTDKAVAPTIMIMQRLSQFDPTGHMLEKQKANLKHICIPGEILNFKDQVKPPELIAFYKDNLMDPVRLSWKVLEDLEADMGQYSYSGQIGQNPVPPGGGMFKVDMINIEVKLPIGHIVKTVRYWDKAGTAGGGAYTAGVKMSLLSNGRWIIEDVKRGRWGSEMREKIIRNTAETDGVSTIVWEEQEPGSSGKDAAEGTIRNLAGYVCYAERPTGDKTSRADPFSVQVNNGNVSLLHGDWNKAFLDELRFFPFSRFKDQTDAADGAFSKLVSKRIACRVI